MDKLTIEDATQFFSEFYDGEHHIPGNKVREYGPGFCVFHDRGGLATFDFNSLTRLVLMAHDRCIRVELIPIRNGIMQIAIWSREREGSISHRHPTIEQAINAFRGTSEEHKCCCQTQDISGVGTSVTVPYKDCPVHGSPGGPEIKTMRHFSELTEEELLECMKICYRSVYDSEPNLINVTHVPDDSGGGLRADDANCRGYSYGLTIDMYGPYFSACGDLLTIPVFEITKYLISRGIDFFNNSSQEETPVQKN